MLVSELAMRKRIRPRNTISALQAAVSEASLMRGTLSS
jgi:hypothetical protein